MPKGENRLEVLNTKVSMLYRLVAWSIPAVLVFIAAGVIQLNVVSQQLGALTGVIPYLNEKVEKVEKSIEKLEEQQQLSIDTILASRDEELKTTQ